MPTTEGPTRTGRPGRDTRRRRRGGLGVFLLASVLPLGAVGWFVLQPQSRREEVLSRIPAGAGGRAIAAAVAAGLLVLLARVALPAFHGASASLLGARGWIASLPMGARILLSPADVFLGVGWFLLQLLFAVDAFLIVATCLLTLLLVVRILVPGFLPGVLPDLAG